MRTDPRKACANDDERCFWAFIHDAFAHPLMALSNWSNWSLRFHDWTSHHAWPRIPSTQETEVYSPRYGFVLVVTSSVPQLFQVCHPRMLHRFGCRAVDAIDAVEQAEQWFDTLTAEGYPT